MAKGKYTHPKAQGKKWLAFKLVLSMLFVLTLVLLVLFALGLVDLLITAEDSLSLDLSAFGHRTFERGDSLVENLEIQEQWTELLSWEPRAFIYHNFLAEELRKSLWAKEVPAEVYVGMRYWHPFTEEAIKQLQFSVETVEYENIGFRVWDVGGHDKGHFEILSLSGSSTFSGDGNDAQDNKCTLSVALADSEGRVFGGSTTGSLIAACPIQLVVATFKQGANGERNVGSHSAGPSSAARDLIETGREGCTSPTTGLVPTTHNMHFA